MSLAIIFKVNLLREDLDKIGFTNKIRDNIIKVIILLSVSILYTIIEICLLALTDKPEKTAIKEVHIKQHSETEELTNINVKKR